MLKIVTFTEQCYELLIQAIAIFVWNSCFRDFLSVKCMTYYSETNNDVSEHSAVVYTAITGMYTNKWLQPAAPWSSSWAWFYNP